MKLRLFILFIYVLVSCKGQIPPPPPPPPTPSMILEEEEPYDTVLNWHIDSYKIDKERVENTMSLSKVRENFYVKDGKLYNYKTGVVNKTRIDYYSSQSRRTTIVIDNGIPFSDYGHYIDEIRPYIYSCDGIEHSLSHDLKLFKKGYGKWTDSYFKIYTNDHWEMTNKEEGYVKDNFKYGKWVYYNTKKEIDSTRNYVISDSIDIRFPHCLFNKKEPRTEDFKTKVVFENYDKIITRDLAEEYEVIPFTLIDEAPRYLSCNENSKALNRECFEEKTKAFLQEKNKNFEINNPKKNRTYIKFVITKNGLIKDISVRAHTKKIKEEVTRRINKLSKIKPGSYKGKSVDVEYRISILLE